MADERAAQGHNINVHTQSVSIQSVPEFNPGSEVGASLAKRWNTWIANFEMFITARAIQDKKQNRATLVSSRIQSATNFSTIS